MLPGWAAREKRALGRPFLTPQLEGGRSKSMLFSSSESITPSDATRTGGSTRAGDPAPSPSPGLSHAAALRFPTLMGLVDRSMSPRSPRAVSSVLSGEDVSGDRLPRPSTLSSGSSPDSGASTPVEEMSPPPRILPAVATAAARVAVNPGADRRDTGGAIAAGGVQTGFLIVDSPQPLPASGRVAGTNSRPRAVSGLSGALGAAAEAEAEVQKVECFFFLKKINYCLKKY
jgi:hypothetical protein